MRLRTALAWVVGSVLSVPALASLAVILTVPPVVGWIPDAAVGVVRPIASHVFAAVGALAPDSLPGRLFHGSFELVEGLGASALAAHAAFLGVPWAILAVLAARRLARPHGPAATKAP